MSKLNVQAVLTIHEGKLDAFKAAAEACIQGVREKDTRTLQYDWYFSPDESICTVIEQYPDSAALLEHIGNLGDTLGDLFGACDVSLHLYGEPSAELAEAAGAFEVTVHSHFGSM